jgi:hypothetical protein
MAITDKLRRIVGGKATNDVHEVSTSHDPEAPTSKTMNITDKETGAGFPVDSATTKNEDGISFTPDAQTGVTKVEAVTQAWSKKSLVTVLIL